jgi:hypothetical protein
MTRTIMAVLTVAAMAFTAIAFTPSAGLAQNKGKGGGGGPPTSLGSSPPDFSSPGNRTGWGEGTTPPGWSKGPEEGRPGWGGSTMPPGWAKKQPPPVDPTLPPPL